MEKNTYTILRDGIPIGEYSSSQIHSFAKSGNLKPSDQLEKQDGKLHFLYQVKGIIFPTPESEELSEIKNDGDETGLEEHDQVKAGSLKLLFFSIFTMLPVALCFFISAYVFNMSKNGAVVQAEVHEEIKDDDVNKHLVKVIKEENQKNKEAENVAKEDNKVKKNFEKENKNNIINNNDVVPNKIQVDINQELVNRGFKKANESWNIPQVHIYNFLRFGNSEAMSLYKKDKQKAIEFGLDLQSNLHKFSFNMVLKPYSVTRVKTGKICCILHMPFFVSGQDFSEPGALSGLFSSGWSEDFTDRKQAYLLKDGTVVSAHIKSSLEVPSKKEGIFTVPIVDPKIAFAQEAARAGGKLYYAENGFSKVFFELSANNVNDDSLYQIGKNAVFKVNFENLFATPLLTHAYYSRSSLSEFNNDCFKIRSLNLSGLESMSDYPEYLETDMGENDLRAERGRPDGYFKPTADIVFISMINNGKEIGLYKKR